MPKNVVKTHSLAQAAAIIDVRRETLSSWIDRKGCPYVTRADKSAGIDWEISIPAVFEWYRASGIEQALSAHQDESGKISKDEADRRRAVALAIVAEVQADEALNLVVARPDAEADMAAFCMALKTGLSNAIAKIASRSATMNSAPEIQSMSEAECNRAFDAAKAELVAKWAVADQARSEAE